MKKGISKKKNLIIASLLIVVSVLLILCLSTYLIIHSYINKLNIVTASIDTEQKQIDDIDIEDLESELDPNITDAPEEVVVSLEDEIRKNMEENSIPIMKDKNVLNVLLIGGDSRKEGGIGRSDAMIIVSINKKTKEIVATSILRDIYLQIPGRTTNTRINNAYAYGGADLLMDTIESNFKIEIDRYASIDFYSFMDVVDAVGGVTLEVTEKEIPIINKYIHELNGLTGMNEDTDVLTEAGTLHLNGKQALGYSRNRYIGTDFERTARQRRVLEKVFLKMKDLSIIELNNLLNIILPQVTTNLTEGEIFSMILNLPSYSKYALKQWSVPVQGSYSFLRIRGMAVIGIDFAKNIKEIHTRVYGEE